MTVALANTSRAGGNHSKVKPNKRNSSTHEHVIYVSIVWFSYRSTIGANESGPHVACFV